MTASDLRFAVRNGAWFIVNVKTGATISGPHLDSTAAINARQAAAEEELTAEFERTRRRAEAYSRELASLNADAPQR